MGSEARERVQRRKTTGPKVYVIGMGMGNPDTLTVAGRRALEASDLIVGAPRLLEVLGDLPARKLALVRTDDIVRELRTTDAAIASVVMSGDIGLHSGASRLFERLSDCELEAIPGISSISYLCARLRTSWQDAHIVSAHGRVANVVGAVQAHAKVFVLTDERSSPGVLCSRLVECGLPDVVVSVGERLSYPDERVRTATAAELAGAACAQPAAMLICNIHPQDTRVGAPHLADDAFSRGKVPMTKEEVRELVVCKLQVRRDDTVWDVGAGTGSVSVELARAAVEGQVMAIERNAEALKLVRRNRAAFGLANLRVVAGEAPAALAGLPVPDRVFVGGSGGQLADILAAVLAANPFVRICVAAVTLETLARTLTLVREHGLLDASIVQVGITRARELGDYHLMQAENPVYLVVANGPGREPEE